ncbi:MAG: hypothetical protein A2481_03285 [Candidatus Yonathbacteria bacterium RIFOXYC2_FULL_47_9]|nr:MAG: hypothetical protein A2481_03285 [Candidatus Yonathbacteria bacterium RIFOXYC2_FULL_47_9]HAT68450.1 dihydrofolate reductase [Candidatus Yonathbacteria bacterium]
MSLNIIVAAGMGNHVIGANGDLPWGRIPKDMKHFRDITMGHPVVMGRKTWESLPEEYKPLPGRENIVITRNASSVKTNKGPVIIFENIDSILEIAKVEDVFVIGGAEIYRLFMPYAENIFLTLVMGEFKGDTYFPSISESGWYKEYMRFNTEKANPYALAFCKFVRKEKQHYIS